MALHLFAKSVPEHPMGAPSLGTLLCGWGMAVVRADKARTLMRREGEYIMMLCEVYTSGFC